MPARMSGRPVLIADCMVLWQVPMVKPGDASMASPFTAKATGVMPCTDIVRQGRATLVTTVQMFKILGLLCLQTAYSLSVQYLQVWWPHAKKEIRAATSSPWLFMMHVYVCIHVHWCWPGSMCMLCLVCSCNLHQVCHSGTAYGWLWMQGIKMRDVQLTLMAFLSSGLFFVISNAKPMPTLSAERPHSNIFCAYVFLSILGQFAMHSVFLIFCYNSALAIMPKVCLSANLCGCNKNMADADAKDPV